MNFVMIKVNTYLKNGDNFTPFQECNFAIKNVNYIEGAIELTVNDVELINIPMWDYVDQLWNYIIQGLVTVFSGDEFVTYFPDQPIELKFLPLYGEYIKISVRCNDETSVIVDKNEFVCALKEPALNFLNNLSTKVPENKETYKDMIAELESLHIN